MNKICACFFADRINAVKRFMHFVHTTVAIKLTEHTANLLTPCSSSFISWSVTLGVLSARRRQCTLSSGTRYSSTSLSGRPRARPCLDVEGTASSRMEPLRVLSCTQHNQMEEKEKTEKKDYGSSLGSNKTITLMEHFDFGLLQICGNCG